MRRIHPIFTAHFASIASCLRRIGQPLSALLDRARSADASARSLDRLPRTEDAARAALADRLRTKARTAIEGDAAVFAAEAWAEGVQVLFVGQPLAP